MVYADKQKEKEYQIKWRNNNKEKTREYAKRYREKYPEKHLDAMRKWQQEHPGWRKKYYQNNKEKELMQTQLWQKTHPEKLVKYRKDSYQKHRDARRTHAKKTYSTEKRMPRYFLHKEHILKMAKELNQKKRSICVWHYSGGSYRCACCGMNDGKIFLEVDHLDNNGANHRREVGSMMVNWLVKNNLPIGYQILCSNCNVAKFRNGGICPHQEDIPTPA